jgi:hypothetical protein
MKHPHYKLIHWNGRASNLLKSELKRHGLTYGDLVDRLAKIGVEEKEVNVRNKLSRGTFTAAYFLQCLEAIGVKELRI